MSSEFRGGAGITFVGIAVAVGQWLIPAEKIGYNVRFALIIIACVLLLAGIGLLGHVFWGFLFPKKESAPFCYLSVYYIESEPQRVHGGFQLLMTSFGVIESINYWISPWGVTPSGKPNDPYYSIDRRKPLIPIIHHGGRAWDQALPIGEYRIDFTTKQGNWYEHLEIYMDKGQVKQRVRVTTEINDRGDVLYSFADYDPPPILQTPPEGGE